MKCPKCGYLGFERVTRCRNCGYEFSLVQAPRELELPIRVAERDQFKPLELPLASPERSGSRALAGDSRRDSLLKPPSPVTVTPELSLFGAAQDGEAPPLPKPASPRPPLAVRRAAVAALPRPDGEPTRQNLLDLASAGAVPDRSVPRTPAGADRAVPPVARSQDEAAGVLPRVIAGSIDLLLLALVDAAVLYLTLRASGLGIDELGVLPKAPLVVFFLIQNGAYLVAFNAGGQTLGKLAVGIKVVTASQGAAVDLGRSLLRTAVWAVLAAPAGLGLLSAIFSRDGRGLHDRFAGTRVVRAGTS